MSHKLQVVLADPTAAQLAELAANAGEPPSRIAAQILRHGIAQAAKQGSIPPPPAPSPPRPGPATSEGSRWIRPRHDDASWAARMWRQIAALHARYPRQLAALKQGWWTQPIHTETLCALVTWREELDQNDGDPREELAFKHQLEDYARSLQQEGGGITKAWQPGEPPPEWQQQN
jgi:hypothetical protein